MFLACLTVGTLLSLLCKIYPEINEIASSSGRTVILAFLLKCGLIWGAVMSIVDEEDDSRTKLLGRWQVFYYGMGHMLNDITASCWFTYLLLFLEDIGFSSRYNLLSTMSFYYWYLWSSGCFVIVWYICCYNLRFSKLKVHSIFVQCHKILVFVAAEFCMNSSTFVSFISIDISPLLLGMLLLWCFLVKWPMDFLPYLPVNWYINIFSLSSPVFMLVYFVMVRVIWLSNFWITLSFHFAYLSISYTSNIR